ncbi:hypothetical protein C4Q28_06120 [Pseudomonas sp. SWI6]|uniref:hypothetical protein n=1 Tax=Pseudomonas sp. SWI6 TaxID=2083051 RepID=UPI000CE5DE30|nr:hypothetical protein [Pseudomonas sp. SWI6]AVD81766.1 hypothetical protein C4Q28_06120 [Pseudomonas sp. SWI6]
MEEHLSTPMRDFLTDPNEAVLEQQFLAHIRALEHQGLPPRTIVRALARVLFTFCRNLYNGSLGSNIWIKAFLKQAGHDFIQQEGFVSSAEELDSLQQEYLEDVEPLGYA